MEEVYTKREISAGQPQTTSVLIGPGSCIVTLFVSIIASF